MPRCGHPWKWHPMRHALGQLRLIARHQEAPLAPSESRKVLSIPVAALVPCRGAIHDQNNLVVGGQSVVNSKPSAALAAVAVVSNAANLLASKSAS